MIQCPVSGKKTIVTRSAPNRSPLRDIPKTSIDAFACSLLLLFSGLSRASPRPRERRRRRVRSKSSRYQRHRYRRARLLSERWKTGPNAQTDLKTGPNAQVDFAPFSPSEMATWNKSSGYTIVSGVSLRR